MAALFFGMGTLTSRILGLLRVSLFYSILPYDVRDAWIAAFRVPNFFRRLLGEGGLSVSFIPIYIEELKKGSETSQKALIQGVFSLVTLVALTLCCLLYFFMDQLIPWWLTGPGFTQVPGKLQMTIQMAKVMVFFLGFITLFAFFMALLNAHKRFTLTGFAPLFLNVAIIGALILFRDSENLPMAATWAVVIGGALQAFVLLPQVFQEGLEIRLTTSIWSPQIRKVITKFLPTLFGVGVLQVLGLINTGFASQLDPGALSHIELGDRLLELPLSLIAVSIGTALLPTLSGHWSSGATPVFRETLESHFKLFYFLALPAAMGLWFLGTDILFVLFQRGEFSANEVPIVAMVLKIYCVTLMAAGSAKIFNQAYYAMGDTLTPALVALFGLVVHLILAPILMDAYGLAGLIGSTASISVLNLSISLLVLQKRVGWFRWSSILSHFGRCATAALMLGAGLWMIAGIAWRQGQLWVDLPLLFLIVAGAVAIYLLLASMLGVDEVQVIRRRFRKRRS